MKTIYEATDHMLNRATLSEGYNEAMGEVRSILEKMGDENLIQVLDDISDAVRRLGRDERRSVNAYAYQRLARSVTGRNIHWLVLDPESSLYDDDNINKKIRLATYEVFEDELGEHNVEYDPVSDDPDDLIFDFADLSHEDHSEVRKLKARVKRNLLADEEIYNYLAGPVAGIAANSFSDHLSYDNLRNSDAFMNVAKRQVKEHYNVQHIPGSTSWSSQYAVGPWSGIIRVSGAENEAVADAVKSELDRLARVMSKG